MEHCRLLLTLSVLVTLMACHGLAIIDESSLAQPLNFAAAPVYQDSLTRLAGVDVVDRPRERLRRATKPQSSWAYAVRPFVDLPTRRPANNNGQDKRRQGK